MSVVALLSPLPLAGGAGVGNQRRAKFSHPKHIKGEI